METGSQVELTPSHKKNKKGIRNGQVDNPCFESYDGFNISQILSTVKEERRDTAHDIVMMSMNGHLEDDYEPYDNRQVDHPTTNMETLLHLLKGSLGTGILAMPHAFAQAGYVLGTICTILIGLLCTYCIHMLIDSCYVLCRRKKLPSMTYTAAMEAALLEGPETFRFLAPYATHVVNAFLLTYQIGTCCVYVVFVSENIHFVLHKQFQLQVTEFQVMLAILIPLILINCIRDLKYLAPFTAIANVLTIISFAIILYYIFREAPTLEGKSPVGHYADFPLFFGTVLFALEAIGVILPLENEMKTPKDFVGKFGVLNQGMCTIIILYVGMGLFGYMRYGDASAGSITLNLPSETDVLASIVQCLLALAIYITHGLACFVAINILWKEYVGIKLFSSKFKLHWEYLLRTVIVLVTFGIAAAVPELDLFISLFGALCLSALGLAFPAIIQSCTYWTLQSRKERITMLLKNIVVAAIGVFGLVVGTYTSLDGIIKKFSGGHISTLHSNLNMTTSLNETFSSISL